MENEEKTVDTTEEVVEDQNSNQSEKTEEEVDYKAQFEAIKAEKERIEAELGGLKRDFKKTKKSDGKIEKTQPDEFLLQKAYLRTANITADDEVELALETAKKWDMSIDKLVDDEDFKVKLEKVRITKANAEATSDLRGSGNQSSAKNEPAYWLAKGTPPTPEQVPDRQTRSKIVRAFMSNSKVGKKFYND